MANRKEVWTTSPRGEGKKDFWLRIGTSFENRDGSWSIVLDALPVNGRLIVRDEREREQQEEARPAARRNDSPSPTRAAPRGRQQDFGGEGDGNDDIPF